MPPPGWSTRERLADSLFDPEASWRPCADDRAVLDDVIAAHNGLEDEAVAEKARQSVPWQRARGRIVGRPSRLTGEDRVPGPHLPREWNSPIIRRADLDASRG
jgi:hypothetical protein